MYNEFTNHQSTLACVNALSSILSSSIERAATWSILSKSIFPHPSLSGYIKHFLCFNSLIKATTHVWIMAVIYRTIETLPKVIISVVVSGFCSVRPISVAVSIFSAFPVSCSIRTVSIIFLLPVLIFNIFNGFSLEKNVDQMLIP